MFSIYYFFVRQHTFLNPYILEEFYLDYLDVHKNQISRSS